MNTSAQKQTEYLMPQKVLFLVRGLPGSGKSTVALNIRNAEIFSTDDQFMIDGEYRFDSSKLGQAHSQTQWNTLEYLQSNNGLPNCVVANTFTQRWEIEPYLRIAEQAGARVVVVDTFDGGLTDEELAEKNIHGVPLESIRAMRERWEHDWRKGNPRAPWERKGRK